MSFVHIQVGGKAYIYGIYFHKRRYTINYIYGGAGIDTVDYSQSATAVSIGLAGASGAGGAAQGDVLSGIEVLVGSQYGDILTGSNGADSLLGGGGADTLVGGIGADLIDGGEGDDVASYATSTTAVNINLTTGVASGGEALGDTMVSIEGIIGSNYNDTLVGSSANNKIVGGAGNDSLVGDAGDDTLEGGFGADILSGGEGMDIADYSGSNGTVTINFSTNTVSGGHATGDVLSSMEGFIGSNYNDTIYAGPNAGFYNGGYGSDALYYSQSATGVEVQLLTNANEEHVGRDTVLGIEYLIGSRFDDTLIGSNAAEYFDGGAGADIIDGGGGVDTVFYNNSTAAVNVNLLSGEGLGGTAEGDRLSNIEALTGSNYNDTLGASNAGSLLMGAGGNDLYLAGAGADNINDSAGSDYVDYSRSTTGVFVNLRTGGGSGGYAAGDTLTGIEGVIGSNYDDTLTAATANSVLTGGAGNDLLRSGAGSDILQGGDGMDVADYSGSTAGIFANMFNSSVTGGYATGDILASVEGITGSSYNDTLYAGPNAGYFNGGYGSDVLSYSLSTSAVEVQLLANANEEHVGRDTVLGIESLTGSRYDDTLIGSSTAETFDGWQGADIIDGGGGMDTVTYANSTAAVNVDLFSGEGLGGTAEGDRLSNIEALTGSNYNDTLGASNAGSLLMGAGGNDLYLAGAGADNINDSAGSDSVDYSRSTSGVFVNLRTGGGSGGYAAGDTLVGVECIIGSNYNDTLVATRANSTLIGGAGDDLLLAEGGIDVLFGGDGMDTVDYSGSNKGVLVNLTTNTVSGGHAANDIIMSIEGVIGSNYHDTLIGNSENNSLVGGTGVDSLMGEAGDDTLAGGAGADTLNGGAGFDIADYTSSAAAVNINLATGIMAGGDAAGDNLLSIEGVIGSRYGDVLTGDGGDNLFMSAGGNDTLTGRGGADSFLFQWDNFSNRGALKTIEDFSASQGDSIVLFSEHREINVTYGQGEALGAVAAGCFQGSDALVLDTDAGSYVYVDLNRDGDFTAASDYAVFVKNAHNLSANEVAGGTNPLR